MALSANDFHAAPLLDYQRLNTIAAQQSQQYRHAEPFPHIVIDDFIPPQTVDLILQESEIPDDRIRPDDDTEFLEKNYNAQFRKDWLSMEIRFGINVRRLYWELNSADFVQFLQTLSGIDAIIPDPYRAGGGIHNTRPGGFLMVHADYNRQPETDLDRRLNIIIYLNKDWQDDYGGHLELWSEDMQHCVKKVAPIAGRAVIFSTGSYTWHGHPEPLQCPPHQSRKSISAFYYSNGRPAGRDSQPHMTVWKQTPEQLQKDNHDKQS